MKNKPTKKVWLVNVSAIDGSIMFQFPTQEEQMNFVEQIKDKVESYTYALNPVKLVLEKEVEKFKKKLN